MRLLAAQRYALGRAMAMVRDRPLAFLLAVALAAVALSLPLVLVSVGSTLAPILSQAQPSPELSVFVATKATPREVDALRVRLAQTPGVASATLRSKDAALAQLAKQSGFTGIAAEPGANPLPDVLIAQLDVASPDAIESISTAVRSWPLVDAVRTDLDWWRKLRSFARLFLTAAALFGTLVVTLIVLVLLGTVRLHASTRADEVAVLALAGATRRFIVRPYAYSAAITLLTAAAIAAAIVFASHATLRRPLAQLTTLYGTPFVLPNPEVVYLVIGILAAGVVGWLIGWAGARLTLARV